MNNNNKISHQELLDQAILMNDKGLYDEAILKLNELIKVYSTNKNKNNLNLFYCHLAMNYSDKGNYHKALYYYNIVLNSDPNDEFGSLGKYLTLVKLKRDEEGIQEMIGFLSRNMADLYKVTIEELLEGLENGFMTDYEFEIKQMAHINCISIEPGASSATNDDIPKSNLSKN